jgi:hypothetical protein
MPRPVEKLSDVTAARVRAGKASVSTLLHLAVLAEDPTILIDGDVWMTASGLRGQIGGDIGTFTFTAD